MVGLLITIALSQCKALFVFFSCVDGWMDGWFHFFSSKGLRKSQFTSIPLTEARICLYNLRMYGHAPLLMGLYNNYSRYYKVRRRLYVNEPFDKLNLSGKNIKKLGLTKYGDFTCLE